MIKNSQITCKANVKQFIFRYFNSRACQWTSSQMILKNTYLKGHLLVTTSKWRRWFYDAQALWEMVHYVKSVQIRSFFWSLFSRIRTEYGEIRSISPYSVRMRENADQKKLHIRTFFTQWLRHSHYKCCVKYKKHLKTAEFAKNAYGNLHFSAKLKAKG